ncbi:ATP/GTP-binding protein [Streptomyces sp. NPDC060194]|uniref:ATP/GTP-binding protein n=1 Tax=Streptomyces sp. NPDC060194 TaxID=3347069 RepID=UPI0036695F13
MKAHALVVLVGETAALASTWPEDDVLSPSTLGAVAGDRAEGWEILCRILESRMAHGLPTVVDGAELDRRARQRLTAVAARHRRTAVLAHTGPADPAAFRAEGFGRVVHAHELRRLEPFLRRLSRAREDALGLDGRADELRLPRRLFGAKILPLWRWTGARGRDGARLAEVRLGRQRIGLAVREHVVRDGDVAVDVEVPCPVDPECRGRSWAPVFSVDCLHRTLTEEQDGADAVCTLHGALSTGRRAGEPVGA